jgi:ATP-binding cassette subfamily B protein
MAVPESNLEKYAWPTTLLGELVENLAYRSGLTGRPGTLSKPPESITHADDETIGFWIDVAAGHLGLEAESVATQYTDLEALLQDGGPAILRLPVIPEDDRPRYVGLVRGGRRSVTVLSQDLRMRRVKLSLIRTALATPFEAPLEAEIDQLINEAKVPEGRRDKVRKAIMDEQLGSVNIQCGWLLRPTPGAPMSSLLRQMKVGRPAALLSAMYIVQILLTVATWYVLGRGIFQGYFDWGWLLIWALLLFTTIPVQMALNDAQSELSIRLGAIFKLRMLDGTLKLEADEIRHQGMGGFLGRVMESEAVEMLGINGGLLAILSIAELGIAAFILAQGAGGAFHALMLIVCVLIILGILWRYFRISKEWTAAYREMTNDLVERMVGHRTRLIQEDHRYWHEEEDQHLDRYLKLSENLDRIGLQLSSISTRGWILIGLASLAVPYITGGASVQALAISLGGILLAAQGLSKLAGGSQSLIGLVLAWGQVGPLFEASTRGREVQPLEFVLLRGPKNGSQIDGNGTIAADGDQQTLLLARDLSFRYYETGKPVIEDCSLKIIHGERYLLEGPSGGGKTTLAALLSGLRKPDSGSLLLWGYDRQILGNEEWRRFVVMAPQFQENHIYSDTLAFNLLMGRRWPPTAADMREADVICRELGLGEVIDRMPSGYQQMLGENGWQLSHGERSRLFIARTLLQNADLVILDESFGALDPENLQRAMKSVLKRAPTLLVIAHP